jgi:sodium/pantothenate symporter
MARDEHVVIRSACIAAVVIAISNLVLFVAATAVNLSKTDISPPEETMIWAALNLMPPIMGTLLLAGIMAAALSSATTFLSLVGFSTSHDVIPQAATDDQSMLRFSRWMMFLVSVITLTISLFIEPNIFWLTYYVGTVFASSWGAVAFMSIWSDKITADGAFWGIVSGFATNVALRLFDSMDWVNLPSYFNPILVGGVVSLIVVILVSRFGTVTDTERARRLVLHEFPESERDPVKTRGTQWAALSVAALGVVVTVMMMVLYVWPYQVATGTLLDGDRLNWFSGESIMAMSWSFLFVPLGLMTYRMIGRAYGGAPQDDAPVSTVTSLIT